MDWRSGAKLLEGVLHMLRVTGKILLFLVMFTVVLVHSIITWVLYVPVIWMDHYFAQKWWFKNIVEPCWMKVDWFYNITSARWLFQDKPQEDLFTYRMRRYMDNGRQAILVGYEPNWQYHFAMLVCLLLLDSVAPNKAHCRCNNG